MANIQLQKIIADIDAAKKLYKQKYEGRSKENIKAFKGEDSSLLGRSANSAPGLTVNKALPIVQTIVQSSVFKDPRWNVYPLDEDSKAAQIKGGESVVTTMEKTLEYIIREQEVKEEVKDMVTDLLVRPYGCVMVKWNFLEEKNKKFQERDDVEKVLEAEGIIPPQDEEPTRILKDSISIESIDPDDIFIDSEARKLSKIRHATFRVVMPLEKAKKMYPELEKMNVSGAAVHFPGNMDAKKPEVNSNPHNKRVALLFHWFLDDEDRASRAILVEGIRDKFVEKPRQIYSGKGFPFIILGDYKVPGESMPITEVDLIRPHQDELNRSRAYMLNHLKRSHIKVLVNESAVGKKGIEAIKSGLDKAIIPVKDTGAGLRGAVDYLQSSPLPSDNYRFEQMVNEDITQITGINDYRLGFNPDSKRSATEIAEVSRGTDVRASQKQEIAEKIFNFVGKKIIEMLQQFADREMLIPIVGSDVNFVKFTKQEIAGNYMANVETDSTLAKTGPLARKQSREQLQVLGGFAQAGINIRPAIENYLDSENVGNKDEILPPDNSADVTQSEFEALEDERALLQGQDVPANDAADEEHIKHHVMVLSMLEQRGELNPELQEMFERHIRFEEQNLEFRESGKRDTINTGVQQPRLEDSQQGPSVLPDQTTT